MSYDGSSAYLDLDSLCELTLKFYIAEQFKLYGFYVFSNDSTRITNIRISFVHNEEVIVTRKQLQDPNRQIPLPIITIELPGSNEDPYQLGGDEGMMVYSPLVTIYASSKLELNKITSFVRNLLDNRDIPIKNYNMGMPLLLEDNSSVPTLVYGTTDEAVSSKAVDPSDESLAGRYLGVVSTTLRVPRQK